MNTDGVTIERGRVSEVCDDGYRVSAYTQDGMTTPPIPAMNSAIYKPGDRVYFFVFDDGHGAILMAF